MIPLTLTLKGLYSYTKEQTIDFTQLTSADLFGIFGPVGSGKSSILEAMTFALYAESDRLNTRDKRYYNMLNLQSKNMYVCFDFLAGKQHREQYRFEVELKRNRNKFDDVSPEKKAARWEADKQEYQPIVYEGAAERVLGMKYEYFRQTVIIPQGKFRAFIETGSTERSKMFEELFHLEQFDLRDETRYLLQQCREEVSGIQGEINALGEVSKEGVKEARKNLDQQVKLKEKVAKETEKAETALKKQDHLAQLSGKLQQVEEQLAHQQKRLPEIKQLEAEANVYEKADRHFSYPMQEENGAVKELQTLTTRIRELEQARKQMQQEVERLEKEYKKAGEEHEKLDTYLKKCDDLRLLIETRKLQKDLQEQQDQLKKAEADQEQKQQTASKLQQQLNDLRKKLQDTAAASDQLEELREVNRWYEQQANLEKQLADRQKEKREQEQYINTTNKQWAQNVNPTFAQYPTLTGAHEAIQQAVTATENELKALKATLKKEEQYRALHQYRATLQPGEACPLCGSTTHEIQHHEADTNELVKLDRQVQEKEQYKQELVRLEATTASAIDQSGRELQRLTQLENAEKEAYKTLEAYRSTFTHTQWKDEPLTNIQEKITRLQKEVAFRRTLREQESEGVKQLEAIQENLRNGLHAIADLKARLQVARNKITRSQTDLQVLSYEKMSRYSIQELEENLDKGTKEVNRVKQDFSACNEALRKATNQFSSTDGQYQNSIEQQKSLERKINSLREKLETSCKEQGFNSLEEVKKILLKPLDPEKVRANIYQFQQELHSLKKQKEGYKQELNGNTYQPQEHEEQKEKVSTLKKQWHSLLESCREQEVRLNDLEEKLEKKQQLEGQLGTKGQRLENLKTMEGLFRSKGFVEFVSSRYLQNLCNLANERFMKLTRQSLSMELDEKNNIVVRDYLNEGKIRSLKTLSGGQTFQAALSLALALADNVRSQNELGKSFFFLDEGFGTQDKDSLRMVFETLKSLKKENRIVGIISHVEELQQEIEVFLQIDKEGDKGSRIRPSWKP
jgi:DNA repair protein SbcC/Rad50